MISPPPSLPQDNVPLGALPRCFSNVSDARVTAARNSVVYYTRLLRFSFQQNRLYELISSRYGVLLTKIRTKVYTK